MLIGWGMPRKKYSHSITDQFVGHIPLLPYSFCNLLVQ
jgi:hypothetical protein